MTGNFIRLAALSLMSISVFAQQPSPGAATPPDEAGPGVARISFFSGDVSVRRGDSGDAVAAAMNAPLLVADTIATGPEARAEVQFDSAHRVRFGSEVEARLAEIDGQKFRMELAHGTVTLSSLRDSRFGAELSTPVVSMRPVRPGLYRVTVGDDGQTTITVRSGEAEIYSEKGTEHLSAGQTMMVRGNVSDPEFQIVAGIGRDSWDSWNEERDRLSQRSESYRYVNPDIAGAEELDGQGTWQNDPAYGEVWVPRVSPDWAPYREGRWIWEDYYGWTWLSSDPWGWAPYHYGNWYRGSFGWCWYPGVYSRPVFWRPALVAFFGFGGHGGGFGLGFGFGGWGNVGWLPLAPFEAFHPWYGRGLGGWGRRNNYVVNNYNVTNVNITNVYRNARVNGAISGVSASSFTNGRFGAVTRVNQNQIVNAGLVRGPLPVTPTAANLKFSERTSQVMPTRFPSTPAFGSASRTPVTARVPFSQQQSAMQQSTQRYSQTMPRTGAPQTFAGRAPAAQPARIPANGTVGSVPGSGLNAAARPGGASNVPSSGSWARFGSPATASRGGITNGGTSNVAAPRTPASNAVAPSPGWGRFGSPNQTRQSVPASPRNGYEQTGSTGYRQSSQPLSLSQPIVHNRTADAPASRTYGQSSYPNSRTYGGSYSTPRESNQGSYSAPHSYSQPSYSQPGYSAPRQYSEPSYSSPRGYSQGSYSAPRSSSQPSYSAPRSSSPSYSAPRSSGSSGGGSHSAPAPSHSSGGSSHSH